MKLFAKMLNDKAQELGYQTEESEFIRNGNKISSGKCGLKFEGGKYALYFDGDVIGTFDDFIVAINGYKRLIRE